MTGTFVGNELMALTTISTGSSMLLNFQSDASEPKGGFVLQYELCKNAIIFQKSKYVSPNNIRRSDTFIHFTI